MFVFIFVFVFVFVLKEILKLFEQPVSSSNGRQGESVIISLELRALFQLAKLCTCSAIKHNAMKYNEVQCSECNVTEYNTIQCNAKKIQCSAKLFLKLQWKVAFNTF